MYSTGHYVSSFVELFVHNIRTCLHNTNHLVVIISQFEAWILTVSMFKLVMIIAEVRLRPGLPDYSD